MASFTGTSANETITPATVSSTVGADPLGGIDLSTIDADAGRGGNQSFTFVGTSAFTGAGQLRVGPASSGSDTVIQANTGGSLAPEMEIAVSDGGTLPGQWASGDFIL